MMLALTKKHNADIVQLQAACHASFSEAAAMVRRPYMITLGLNYLAETLVITPHSAAHSFCYTFNAPQASLNLNPF